MFFVLVLFLVSISKIFHVLVLFFFENKNMFRNNLRVLSSLVTPSKLILLITDLDHLINVFTNETKLSNIASIIGTGIYGLLHLTVDDQFLINPVSGSN